MPTKVNVRVNTIQHTSQVSAAGNTLNYVEITGFNETDNKGFKKRFFSTKKDGTATKNAETADSLNKDDWIEIVLDDTSYQNVQTLRKIAAPANASAPSQSGTTSSAPATGGTNKMSKADWAEKDRLKAASIARSVALKSATDLVIAEGVFDVDTVIEVATKMAEYLTGPSTTRETSPNGNTIVKPTAPVEEAPAPGDDDIPF